MTNPAPGNPIIVFGKTAPLRDYWRAAILRQGKKVLCFEKETICFDNLTSIEPDAICLITDSPTLVWRFLFALHASRSNARLLVISDTLTAAAFQLFGLKVALHCQSPETGGTEWLLRALEPIGPQPTISSLLPDQDLLIGQTPALRGIRAALPGLREARDPILITGEPGTGKELLARTIADHTPHSALFVKLDCPRLDYETLAGWILAEPPAPKNTGFPSRAQLDTAESITLLLDQVDKMDENAQGRMLMLLEVPWKGRRPRFIATATIDLASATVQGRFRKDLFYRLNVIPIALPPLRCRPHDIPMLADYFAIVAGVRHNGSFVLPSEHTLDRLAGQPWPGNLDGLRAAMDQLAVTGDEAQLRHRSDFDRIKPDPCAHLSRTFHKETLLPPPQVQGLLAMLGQWSLKSICDQFVSRTEKKMVQNALEFTNWNRRKAAELLNISYKSMLNKMKNYEIV